MAGGKDRDDPSVSWKAYVDRRVEDHDMLVSQMFRDRDSALDAARASIDYRLAQMNEFRGQLSDQARTYLPRSEFDTAHDALTDRVNDLAALVASSSGQSSGSTNATQLIVYVVLGLAAISSLVVSIIALHH